jgi:hypothetical protein
MLLRFADQEGGDLGSVEHCPAANSETDAGANEKSAKHGCQ